MGRKNRAKEILEPATAPPPVIVGNTCESLPPEYQDECRKNKIDKDCINLGGALQTWCPSKNACTARSACPEKQCKGMAAMVVMASLGASPRRNASMPAFT